MSKRTTKVAVTPDEVTEAQMRKALTKYVEAHCEIARIEAEFAQAVEKLKAQAEKDSKSFRATLEVNALTVQNWALQNKSSFEGDNARKMEVYGGHKIGFQTSPPAVKWCKPTGGSGTQKEEGFIIACKASGGWAEGFVRTVEEADKEAVLKWFREAKEVKEVDGLEEDEDPKALAAERAQIATIQLATLGARVVSAESFVIDLNLQPESK
ncbi:host-nuclease inhibitor Gam family protein [Verrucomicrobium spinosum]|uniref:host-nuclease inhibitor Gam family protein n=1 Tax=Verrucomicrobium spinosum TaxID=2736 RepID=UPI00017452F0|nr:host-nuclease inhibitor Gam family protein [Verrucomicrobium spinosum]